jgi:hypothetical protein
MPQWHIGVRYDRLLSYRTFAPFMFNFLRVASHYTRISWRWRGVCLEQLTVTKTDNKLPAFYGTRMFITVFTTARSWILFSCRNRIVNLVNAVRNLRGVLYSTRVNTGYLKRAEAAVR